MSGANCEEPRDRATLGVNEATRNPRRTHLRGGRLADLALAWSGVDGEERDRATHRVMLRETHGALP